MKKKLCSILLALTMLLTLLPVSALAEGETPAEAPVASNVAKIGDQEYATLAGAVEKADSGATVTLLKDVTVTEPIKVTKSMTLDLNGHVLTAATASDRSESKDVKNSAIWVTAEKVNLTIDGTTAGSGMTMGDTHDTSWETKVWGFVDLRESSAGSTVTVNGGSYTGSTCASDNYHYTALFTVGSESKLVLNNVSAETDERVVKASGCGEVIVSGGTYNITGIDAFLGAAFETKTASFTNMKLTAKYGGCVQVGNNATFENCEIKVTDIRHGAGTHLNCAVAVQYGGTATVKSGIYTAPYAAYVYSSGGTINIENGTFTGVVRADATTDATATINIKNGSFNGEIQKDAGADNETISISGGTFTDLSALDYLAEGANVTVKLAADTTKDVTIPAGTTVTLDLNGHKIVNSATAQDKEVADASRKHTITNNGTLTILDSVGGGVVDNVSHGRAALYNAGTIVEIKGGKFTRSVDNSTDATSAKGNSWYVVYNAEGANITKISSGEFLALGHFSSLFCNSGTINEISGGTFTQDGFIAFKNEGTVNKISGGTFSSESESCIQNWGTIGEISDGTITAGRIGIWNFSSDTYKSAGTISRITGGNISGTTAAIRLNDYDTDYKDSDENVTAPSTVNKANASISAGNFSGALEVNANTVLTITGGTYTSDPSAYVVPGYVASYNGSTYTVYYPVPVIPNNNNNSSSTTTKNPDGSTTTTTTDKATGAVTETTTTANGSVGTVKTGANGSTEISASISAADVKAAEQKNAPVIAPITVTPAASSAAAPVIKLSVPANAGEVAVAIPVVNAKQGTVAVRVNPDGTEEIIKTAVVTENGLVLGVKGSMQIKVINNSKNFVDTVGHWAASDVDFVSARELFNGTAPALFSPEASMTRGMVVTVIARLAGENTDGGANWYDKGCAWAVANGVSDGTDPNGSITREQLAAMLYRYCGSPAASGSLSAYADAASVSAFASDAMLWCVNNGIINGMDGLLNPQGQATRAQVSAMFARYIRMAAAK